MGSVKGRIEAVQVRIEDGASVDADVIVDEAIIAGEFTGNLTCRDRLEARASGRINGRVETFKLMLHEGASVEGEMHMLTESPKDASATIRGSAPARGEKEPEARSESRPDVASVPAATRPAPAVMPTSSGKGSAPAGSGETTATASSAPSAAASGGSPEARATRSSVAETLRAETLSMRVAPRTTTASRGYAGSVRSSANGSRNNSTTSGF